MHDLRFGASGKPVGMLLNSHVEVVVSREVGVQDELLHLVIFGIEQNVLGEVSLGEREEAQ